MHLFAYGTLMDEDIFQRVSGFHSPNISGVLPEYRRISLAGRSYPGLIPCAESKIAGRLYLELRNSQWQSLDVFEGEEYYRQEVIIIAADHLEISASVYMLRPEFAHLQTKTPWSFETFLDAYKLAFLNQYPGWQKLAGKADF